MNPQVRPDFILENQATQRKLVKSYHERELTLLPYEVACQRSFATDWSTVQIDRPSFLGVHVERDIPLESIVPFIDWSPFFMAWELKGKYPRIFEDATIGAAARELFRDAQTMLDMVVQEKLLTANAVHGFWPAQSDGDDIVLYTDESREHELARFHMLRQQWERQGQTKFRSLADYVAPLESGRTDYLGAFAVTTGLGAEALAARYERDHDDVQSIMIKAIADRLAEALAEKLHAQARAEWEYGAAEQLSKEELIAEKYRGIRPAHGYPACPDHTEKRTLFRLLEAEKNAGIELTEGLAMTPAASVSGLYFAHPEARYFAVGRIARDQLEAYARRKGMSVAEVEKWLAPNLE
jgi:5-methyltetrahydrofolate--homocysteine methyltransferase